MIPDGDRNREYEIAEMEIILETVNEETQDATYRCNIYNPLGGESSTFQFKHNRKDGIYTCIKKALEQHEKEIKTNSQI